MNKIKEYWDNDGDVGTAARFFVMMCLMVMIAVIAGCWHTRPGPIDTPIPETGEKISAAKESTTKAAKDIDDVNQNLGEINNAITSNVKSIETKDEKGVMKPEVKGITKEVQKSEVQRGELTKVSTSLRDTQGSLAAAESEIEQMKGIIESERAVIAKLEEDNAELEKKLGSALQRMLMYLVLAGVVMVAICGMLIVNGNAKAIGLGVAGIVLVVASLAISFFMTHLAIIGLCAGAIAILLIGYKIYEHHTHKKAIRETVKTTEKIKQHLHPEDRNREFGDMVGDGEVGAMQSDSTKKIVREERARLATEAAPTMPPEPVIPEEDPLLKAVRKKK
jgi:hypothetical protein